MRALGICIVLMTFACRGKEEAKHSPEPDATVARLALMSDPGAALSVKEAKEKGPGEEVVVVGRVKEIVRGYAAFHLIDASLDYCGQKPGTMTDDTPWDYCCETPEVRAAATLIVEVRGPDGRPVAAQSLPLLRLLDLVAVKGKVERDEHGNVAVVASGWFRRERPDLPEGLRWPE
jgi:hypothetical protein